ncbi:ethanolamine ammonia-lyase subunit EutC [Acetobacter aceti]|uniref:Ethanolamine ammonia-lyase small subunit n=1 Tax=Acetobacter aceti TaxID=435 RepID=A0A6S6PMB0_ACEAC|nr:ethanolamine ammonia-lyase subunit EutC [Acetobacter aceti]BCI68453.1 ethanolamine ammonia-lyase light chain [Acetobacter aceti]
MTDKTLPTASTRGGSPDPWQGLRSLTRARIGLGRSGNAQRSTDVLAFQAAHAQARDAVHTPLDIDTMQAQLKDESCLIVHSRAPDRPTYLRRPDLGRRLDAESLASLKKGCWDVVFIAADGLSSVATTEGAVALYHAMKERLKDWSIAPLVIAKEGRVAIGDEIAAAMGASMVVMMIGERPGLSVANSMGAYLTYAPRVGCPDSARNCLSNIHPHGQQTAAAADKLAWLMREARQRKLTGVDLKDDAPESILLQQTPPALDKDTRA